MLAGYHMPFNSHLFPVHSTVRTIARMHQQTLNTGLWGWLLVSKPRLPSTRELLSTHCVLGTAEGAGNAVGRLCPPTSTWQDSNKGRRKSCHFDGLEYIVKMELVMVAVGKGWFQTVGRAGLSLAQSCGKGISGRGTAQARRQGAWGM